jgi:hypothetical protein
MRELWDTNGLIIAAANLANRIAVAFVRPVGRVR